MSIVAPRSDTRQAPLIRAVNVVPTPATRWIAQRVIFEAETTTGPDAALTALREVAPDQLPALLGLILTATKVTKKVGRPRLPLQFNSADRKKFHTRYKHGDRTPETIAGEREYQRVNQRNRRARKAVA